MRGRIHASIPTAFQYSLIPLGGSPLARSRQITPCHAPPVLVGGRFVGPRWFFFCRAFEGVYMAIRRYFKCVFCGGALANPGILPQIRMAPFHSANSYLVGMCFTDAILLRLGRRGSRFGCFSFGCEYNYLGNASRRDIFRRDGMQRFPITAAAVADFSGLCLDCGWISRQLMTHFFSAPPHPPPPPPPGAFLEAKIDQARPDALYFGPPTCGVQGGGYWDRFRYGGGIQ